MRKSKNGKLAAPNVVGATRRHFLIKGSLVGAGALTGSAACCRPSTRKPGRGASPSRSGRPRRSPISPPPTASNSRTA